MKSFFLMFVAYSMILVPAAAAKTQNTTNISIPETPISISLPNDYEIYGQDMIDLKFQPGPQQPTWVAGSNDGTVSVAFSINSENISATPLAKAMNQMKMGLSQHRTELKWINTEIKKFKGKSWAHLEFISPALDSEIINNMFFSSYGKKMILLNINATTKEYAKHEESIQKIIKSITYEECANNVRLMTKSAHDKKKKFDDFWLDPNREVLNENLSDYGDDVLLSYQRAVDSAFLAGKSSWYCNELPDMERHYWAYHHIAATNYLKMSIGLAEEVWLSFEDVSDSFEMLEENIPYKNPQLLGVTDKFSDGTYYSAAHTRLSSGIALMYLGRYEEAKNNLNKAGELITKNPYSDIENAVHVLTEVTSSLFVLPRDVVSYKDAIRFIPFSIDLAMTLFPENTSYKDAIQKMPHLAEIIAHYIKGLKSNNDYKAAQNWSKILSEIDSERP